MSTAATRAQQRDYWNSPNVVTACKALDYSFLIFSVCALMALGSLFN